MFTDRSLDLAIRPPDSCSAAQVQLHAAHVSLVRDRFGINLEHDVAVNALRGLDRFLFARSDVCLDDGNAIRCEDFLRLDLSEEGALCFARRSDDVLGVSALGDFLVGVSAEGRCFVEAAQVVAVTPHVVERARRGIGIGERRDAGTVEDLLASTHLITAHPTRKDRFSMKLRERFELLSGGS